MVIRLRSDPDRCRRRYSNDDHNIIRLPICRHQWLRFDHCPQYDSDCISAKRETVRSKANASSSPLNTFALVLSCLRIVRNKDHWNMQFTGACSLFTLSNFRSSISMRSESPKLFVDLAENSCFSGASADITTYNRKITIGHWPSELE